MAILGWANNARLSLLLSKRKGRAVSENKCNFDLCLSLLRQELTSFDSAGKKAFYKWNNVPLRMPSEGIEPSASMIEDSLHSAFAKQTPPSIISDLCCKTFISKVNDEFIVAALLCFENLYYHRLVNHAGALKQHCDSMPSWMTPGSEINSPSRLQKYSFRQKRFASSSSHLPQVSQATQNNRTACKYCNQVSHSIEQCGIRLKQPPASAPHYSSPSQSPPLQSQSATFLPQSSASPDSQSFSRNVPKDFVKQNFYTLPILAILSTLCATLFSFPTAYSTTTFQPKTQ